MVAASPPKVAPNRAPARAAKPEAISSNQTDGSLDSQFAKLSAEEEEFRKQRDAKQLGGRTSNRNSREGEQLSRFKKRTSSFETKEAIDKDHGEFEVQFILQQIRKMEELGEAAEAIRQEKRRYITAVTEVRGLREKARKRELADLRKSGVDVDGALDDDDGPKNHAKSLEQRLMAMGLASTPENEEKEAPKKEKEKDKNGKGTSVASKIQSAMPFGRKSAAATSTAKKGSAAPAKDEEKGKKKEETKDEKGKKKEEEEEGSFKRKGQSGQSSNDSEDGSFRPSAANRRPSLLQMLVGSKTITEVKDADDGKDGKDGKDSNGGSFIKKTEGKRRNSVMQILGIGKADAAPEDGKDSKAAATAASGLRRLSATFLKPFSGTKQNGEKVVYNNVTVSPSSSESK